MLSMKDISVPSIYVNKFIIKLHCQEDFEKCGSAEDEMRMMFKSFLSATIKKKTLEVELDIMTRLSLIFPGLLTNELLNQKEKELMITESSALLQTKEIILASQALLKGENLNIIEAVNTLIGTINKKALEGEKLIKNQKPKRLKREIKIKYSETSYKK